MRVDDPFMLTMPAVCMNHDMPVVSTSPETVYGALSPGMKSPSNKITSPAGVYTGLKY